ncbi:MAG: sialate O-acetylesterase [Rariglobus sp.]
MITSRVCGWFLIFAPVLAHAEVKPSALFSDNAVLQQGADVPVWGTGRDGEVVTVTFGEHSVRTTTKDGRWRVTFTHLKPGTPQDLVIKGDNTVVARNVVGGEVWLCSGQSNMARTVVPPESVQPRRPYWEESAAAANYPLIRHFRTGGGALDEPAAEITGKWEICTPETVRGFTAVGYFFAKDLHAARGVPVGLINSSVGATGAASWVSRETLLSHPMLKPNLDRQEKNKADYPALLAKYQADEPRLLAEYTEAAARAKAEGKPEPRKPQPPRNPFTDAYRPAGYYNSKIAPLAPYALRGVLWYQGESNSGHAAEYRVLFRGLIDGWRTLWQQPAMPFLFVQLPEYKGTPPEIRESQLFTWRETPHTGMVVTIDCGDAGDIHPPDKRPVGARLALMAREQVYGEKIAGSGPRFDAMRVEDGKAVLTFSYTGGGLIAKSGTLEGFEIAGPDKKFVPAEAKVVGDKVVVSSPAVTAPVMARYAWQNVPMPSLYNREGLPASPFLAKAP